jgi:hypothetical protein
MNTIVVRPPPQSHNAFISTTRFTVLTLGGHIVTPFPAVDSCTRPWQNNIIIRRYSVLQQALQRTCSGHDDGNIYVDGAHHETTLRGTPMPSLQRLSIWFLRRSVIPRTVVWAFIVPISLELQPLSYQKQLRSPSCCSLIITPNLHE